MSCAPPVPTPDSRRLRVWVEYYETLFPDATMPPKRWQLEVATYLFDRRYHPDLIRRALEHAADLGTVETCDVFDFDPFDRATVEAMLPERVADWHHPVYAGRWAVAGTVEHAEFGPALT